MFQSQANQYNKPVPVPWRAINEYLAGEGAPAIDVISFGNRYDAEDPSGPLHNIVNSDRDRFSDTGIVFVPDNQVSAPEAEPEIDPEHSQVQQMASSELSRSKK